MNRIVVVRAGGLGDTILAIPAVRALRSRFPGARIEVVGYPANWEVAGELVDEIDAVDRRVWAGLAVPAVAPQLRQHLSGVDLVVAWTARPPALDDRPLIYASPYPPPGSHAADHLLRSLEPIVGPQTEPAVPRLSVSGSRRRGTLLHPGAGAAWKRWPAERFAALARFLGERGHDVTLIEGPADKAAVAEVRARTFLPVIRPPSPRVLAEALAGAELYVGNDSGVTHLAAAAGARVVALFGPTDPVAWGPRGKVRLLRRCSKRVTAADVRVCDDPWCMEAISLDDVQREILALDDDDLARL